MGQGLLAARPWVEGPMPQVTHQASSVMGLGPLAMGNAERQRPRAQVRSHGPGRKATCNESRQRARFRAARRCAPA